MPILDLQIHLTETTDDEGSDAVVLPAAAAKNLARSCGCSTTDACSAEGGAEAALAVDADVSSCTSLGGIAGERGVWMVDLGSSLEMDAVTVQVPADTDVVLLDHGSVHIGMSRTWSDNAACSSLWSSMARQEGAAISVQVNCYGSGQFLFIVAAKDVALSLCDVEVRQAATLIGTGFLLPPQSGSGMSFDGSMFADPCVGGSGIEIGGNGLTLSAWVKVDSSDMLSGTVYLFDISRGDVHNMMLLLQDGVVVYSFVNDECEAAVCAREELSATAAGALAVGQWTHIAVVHEQSDSVTVLFNSMSVASGSLPQPARFQRRSCRVGKGWPAWNVQTLFQGEIGDLFLWDSALDHSDVLLVMNGISVPSERLVLSLAVQGASSKPAVSVRVGGTACEQTSWGSATSVGCVAAPGVSGGTSVVLTLPNRGVVTKVAGFHYETPRLEEVPHPRPLLFHVQSLDADIGNLNADVRRTRLKQCQETL